MTTEIRNMKYPFNWIAFAYKYGNSDDSCTYEKLNELFTNKDYEILVKDFDSIVDNIKETNGASKCIERNIDIFKDVFKHKMTYVDTAKKYDICTARIRQIVSKMTRLLKHYKYVTMMVQNSENESEELSSIDLTKKIISELSTRAANVLKRTLNWTIGVDDITDLTFADIVHTRCCGHQSLIEIMEMLKKYDVKLQKQSIENKKKPYISANDKYAKRFQAEIMMYFGSIDNI